MERSKNGVLRGVGLLTFLAVIGLPSAWADDGSSVFDPPQARIHPPTGITSQARILPPSGATSQSRIRPPSGEPTSDSRIRPPGGATAQPSWYELLINWLRTQARIHPPTG
jgi:hypothetical protein